MPVLIVMLRVHAAAWRQVGHAGTLDPLATGLLIICVGKATKQINTYVAAEKEYTGARRRHASLFLCMPRPASFSDAHTHCVLQAGRHAWTYGGCDDAFFRPGSKRVRSCWPLQ